MMKTGYKIVVGIVVLALLAVGAWQIYKTTGTQSVAVPDVSVPPPLGTSTPVTVPLPGNLHQYKNADFHFSINYPDTLAATEYKEQDGALTVTFVNADNSQSFEIYVTPYDKTQIDQARFTLDEPSGTFLEPQQITIAGTQATMFYGRNGSMGDTREVWFIKGGYLYEVATFKALDSWLGTIMQSWQFI